jgi:crossover junction endodeoxyribonuclease RuvC
MRILGIDPGIGRMGWGVVEENSGKLKAVDYGCIETAPNSPIAERLKIVFESIQTIIAAHNPDALSIEELFFNTNAKTAFVVGQARGVVLLAAAQANVPVSIYTPLQIKMALTGYGRAEKSQVGYMVKTLLLLSTVPKPDDTADALAIALTHAFSRRLAQKV